LLVAALLLGLFTVTSLQLWQGALATVQQGQRQGLWLTWMDSQLNRDEGLLRRAAPAFPTNCADPQQRLQRLAVLGQLLTNAGMLPAGKALLQAGPPQRLVQRGAEGLLLQLSDPDQTLSRERHFSLEGLGVCLALAQP
jgi:hypothetical protein